MSSKILLVALVLLMLITAAWRLQHPPRAPREGIWLSDGVQQFERGNYRAAFKSSRKTLSINPHNERATEVWEIATFYRDWGEDLTSDFAIDEYKKLTQKHPDSNFLKMLGGEVYFATGKLDLALSTHQSIAESGPEIPQNWYYLGVVQSALFDQEAAIRSLSRAIDLSPEGLYLDALAAQYFLKNQWDVAAELYQKASDKDPGRLSSKLGYYRSLVFSKRYEASLEYGEKLIQFLQEKPSVVAKRSLKAGLIFRQGKIGGIPLILRTNVIAYCKLLNEISNQLLNNQPILADQFLKRADSEIQPVLQYDFKYLK